MSDVDVRSTAREVELRRRQDVLARFGELALRSDDLEEILTEACSLVGEALGTDLSKVMELQEDGITLLVRSGVGWKPGVVGEVTVKAAKGSSEGHALQTARAVTSADIETETRFVYADFLKDNGVRALVNVIIHGAEGERPYGILEVDSRSPRAFTEDDVSFLRGYANLLAGAVARFGLLEQARIREHALQESEDHARAAIDLNPQIPWAADSRGNVTEVSPRWAALTGLSEQESLGTGWGRLVHPDDLPAMSDAWRQSVATGDPLDIEARIRTEDGNHRWLRVRAFPRRDAQGAIVRWYGTTEDVQERRDLADALRGWSETLERRVAERTEERDRTWRLTQDLLAVADRDGTLRSVNAAWTKALGWREDELVGTDVIALTHPDDLVSTKAAFAGVFAAPLAEPYENRLRQKDGGYRLIAWTAAFEAGHVYASGRDITDQREKEVALAQAESALRQSQKLEAVGQLTGGVAHDFNNLLTVLRSSVDLLRRPNITEDRRRRYLDAISDTVDRAAKLTGQLLAFARRQALKPEVFDAGERIRAVADMLDSVTGSRIRVSLNLSGESCHVRADASQFETAVVNMAVNARDAMSGEGTLTLGGHDGRPLPPIRGHAGSTTPFVAISLTDTGVGIPADQVSRIFEPFFTTKGVGKGTGLGLSQVFGFAKQSGGDVDVESVEGRGTTFTLYLPHVTASEDASGVGRRKVAPAGGGRRVLVVEDNVEIGRFATQILADLGYQSQWVANADEALARLATPESEFDVVFSDVVMPGMNGVDLAHEIRRRHPDLPVVLTSGYSHVLAAEGPQGFDLVHKPYSAEQVSRALRRATAASRRGPRAGLRRGRQSPAKRLGLPEPAREPAKPKCECEALRGRVDEDGYRAP